ncbi:MAG TPA: secondary thiamine-phosphate synthase enzyme YjbQ [Arenicellales bacterium]|nr:secondary thiamine-phosphate synthase enzyme YjbQ [Arenicellales bacterium]
MIRQFRIEVPTQGRGTYDITREVAAKVAEAGARTGLAHLFIHHTSASLLLCENADPAVRSDLETFMARLVPDGDPDFRHDEEGPDDMPAHVRSILTECALTIPVTDGRLALGTWQGIYVYEHRHADHRRSVTITVHGE